MQVVYDDEIAHIDGWELSTTPVPGGSGRDLYRIDRHDRFLHEALRAVDVLPRDVADVVAQFLLGEESTRRTRRRYGIQVQKPTEVDLRRSNFRVTQSDDRLSVKCEILLSERQAELWREVEEWAKEMVEEIYIEQGARPRSVREPLIKRRDAQLWLQCYLPSAAQHFRCLRTDDGHGLVLRSVGGAQSRIEVVDTLPLASEDFFQLRGWSRQFSSTYNGERVYSGTALCSVVVDGIYLDEDEWEVRVELQAAAHVTSAAPPVSFLWC